MTDVLVLLGVSHHDLELADLQRLSAGAEDLARTLVVGESTADVHIDAVRGAVVLATCNRVEIYVDVRRFHDGVDQVIDALAVASGRSAAEVAGQLDVRVGAPVAAHLFAVAAGLDAMVVGEAEISGQVARALRRAQSEATVSPTLNQLFQRAARTAKQVHTHTRLGAAGRSIASVALDVVEHQDGPVAGRTALIIGTGSYARVVASALRSRGCSDLLVYSVSDRAHAFAQTHGARPVSADELPAVLATTDLVVACSGRAGTVISADMISAAPGRTVTVVDLALRSDIAPGVRQLPQVSVVDLHTVATQAPEEQTEALIAAQDIVITAVAEFEDSLAVRALDPAIVALRSHVSGVVEREMDRLRLKYDESVAAELEQSLHRVTRSLLHTPTLRAQELARSGDSAGYLAALHTLFGIELTPEPQPVTASR